MDWDKALGKVSRRILRECMITEKFWGDRQRYHLSAVIQ